MTRRIDVFCQVIDNLGDIGVSWRLARQLTQEHNCQVRLWVDRIESLNRLEPAVNPALQKQSVSGVDIWLCDDSLVAHDSRPLPDLVIAAFSCDLPGVYLQRLIEQRQQVDATGTGSPTLWIQLEYLSAQPWVEGFHLQPSLRSDNLKPVYFFPGFTAHTGGLIREQNIVAHASVADRSWLTQLGVPTEMVDVRRIISVFTYPDAPLEQFVQQLEQLESDSLLLIPEGIRTDLTHLDPGKFSHVHWTTIPFLRQTDYDRLLACTDLNLVRGEDSFVRAIWAGKPFIWNIYRQQEREHHHKLQAWLDRARMPESVGKAMHQWSEGCAHPIWKRLVSGPDWYAWQQACLAHRNELISQDSLSLQLLRFYDQEN